MSKREIKTTLAVDGEKKYKQALSDAGRQIRVLGSELNATTSAFGENANKIDVLSTKNENLRKQAEQQEEIVKSLANAVKETAEKYGDASERTDAWRIKLNNATTSLNKMKSEISANDNQIENYRKEADDAGKKTIDLSGALSKAGSAAHGLGKGLSAAAGVMGKGIAAAAKATAVSVAAIGAAAVAAAKGIYDLSKSAGEYADSTLTLSAQTGIATGTLQEWQYAARFVDTEVEDMTKGLAKVTKAMGTAAGKNNDYIELSGGLKVAIKDANGQMLSSEDAFYSAIDALGSMTDETQREIAAQELFGKSYQDMMPLIKAGSDGLKKYGDEAQKMGLVLDDTALGALGNFDDTMQRINAQTEGLGRQLAVSFLPAVSSVMSGVQEIMSEIGSALKDGIQPEDIKTIGDAISKKLVEGMKAITKYLPEIMTTLSSMLSEVVSLVVQVLPTLLPALMDGATQLLTGLLDAISANMQPLVDMAILLVTKFADFLITALPQLTAVAVSLILALTTGLIDALPELIPAVIDMINQITMTLLDNIPALIDAAMQIVQGLTKGLVDAIPVLVPALVEMALSIAQYLLNNLPLLIDAVMQIMVALAAEIIANLPLILGKIAAMLPQIILTVLGLIPMLFKAMEDIKNKLFERMKTMDWKKIGKSIVDGVWTGIKNAADWLWNQVKGFFSGLLTNIKNFLGIHSPSKKTQPFGKFLARGIGVGFTEEMKKVNKDMNNSISTDFSGTGSGGNPIGSSRSGGAVVITTPVYLDGQIITRTTSKRQSARNSSYARAVGVTA